jgi:hypothetical protein
VETSQFGLGIYWYPIAGLDGIVSSCGEDLQQIEVDSHTYGRHIDHLLLSSPTGSGVCFVLVPGKCLL